jgi:uncharacterized repeat protein (TIGR01451 family)
VSLSVPGQVLIGTQLTFNVTFKPGTNVGYGPFLTLVLDGGTGATKPNCACDGLTFVSAKLVKVNGGPTDLTPLSTQARTGPCGGGSNPAPHPFASSGVQPVTVPTGAQIVTIMLPYGSVDPSQPQIDVQVTVNISPFADAFYPLKISAMGGFRYGTLDAVDNPLTDPPVFTDATSSGAQITNSAAWGAQAQTMPVPLAIKKEYLGPEGENATGPNFVGFYPLRYKLTVQVAPGQTLSNVVLNDCLPDNMAFHQLVSVTPAATVALPVIDAAAPNPNCLKVTWPSLAGSASVVFSFFIPEKDANGNPVLPPNCAPADSKNMLKVEGDWTPSDPCDSPQHVVSGPIVNTLSDKCLAVQKSVTLFKDTGAPGYTPGDILQYNLSFQIADPKTFGSLDIVDSLSDGQSLLLIPGTLDATLMVTDRFGTTSGNFSASEINVASNTGGCGTGATALTFKVSQKMISLAPPNPRHAAGILTGGLAAAPASTIPATGQLVFYAKIDDQFSQHHSPGDLFVDKEDPIRNCVLMGGKVMTNVNPPALPTSTGVVAQDDSSTLITLVGDTMRKTVFAVKRPTVAGGMSVVCGPGSSGACANSPNSPQEVRPGDQVTYRIEKVSIPSSDAEKLTIEDWLPKPTYSVTGMTFANTACGIPAPGQACLGPTDTLHTLPVAPTASANPATNSVKFDYGSFNDPTNKPRKLDLLFTTGPVTNLPFADGLFLSNIAQECEQNTFGDRSCQVAIAQVNLREPKLVIRKAAVFTNGAGTFVPAPPAPPGVVFNLGGFASGVINSTNVGLINSDLSNADANDIVTFAITIENVGGAPAYDAKVAELVPLVAGNPSCFTIVPNSIQIKRGTGAPVVPLFYSIAPTSIANGFTVTSNPALPIPIAAFHPTSGANIVVITFQAKMNTNVMPGCCANSAEIKQYTSQQGGPNFVDPINLPNLTSQITVTDTAQVCVKPTLTKSLVTSSEAHTVLPDVALGEIVRFRLVVQQPETGLLNNFKVIDALPPGMQFLSDNTARIAFVSNTGITRVLTGVPALSSPLFNVTGFTLPTSALLNARPPIPAGVISGGATCGAPVTFNLGNVKNNDNDPDFEYIVIEFNALVCNVMGNQAGTSLNDTFSVWVNDSAGVSTNLATSNAVGVNVVEPNITINKTVSPTSVVQGSTGPVNYNVTATNNGSTTAFEVVFTDTLPAGLTPIAGSLIISPLTPGCTGSIAGQSVNATCPRIAKAPGPNSAVTIKYWATINSTSCPATLTNQARVTWTNLPGLKGTTANPTLSNTTVALGNSGTNTGERNGTTAPPSLNDYAANASAPLAVACPPCGVAPPPGMVAWWPFDETNGAASVKDIAGFNNQGTPKPGSPVGSLNAPIPVAGRVSGALNFDPGLQQNGPNVEVPDHPEINFGTGNFSIDAWVYVPAPPAIYIHPIVDKLVVSASGTQGTGYALYLVSSFANGARLQFIMGDGGTLVGYGPNAPSVPFNTWTHVAMTVNRGAGTAPSTVAFYINGALLPAPGPPIPAASINNNLPLLIGESRPAGPHQAAITIDELEMFNRVVAQNEIQGIFNAGAGGKCKCLTTSNETITCNPNGTFNYTFTLTNLSSSTVGGASFSPSGSVTITPSSVTFPPLPPGGSTTVTVVVGGAGAVSGANVCLSIGLTGGGMSVCRIQQCIKLPPCSASASPTVNRPALTSPLTTSERRRRTGRGGRVSASR